MSPHQATFDNAANFQGLVEANVRFLEGELDFTPYHFGPLMKESDLIVNELLDMCLDIGTLTIGSQPAYINPKRKQRGYVTLFIKATDVDLEELAEELENNNLEVVVERSDYSEAYGAERDYAFDYSQGNDNISEVLENGEWKGTTFFNPGPSRVEELELYDCAGYCVSKDKAVISVHAVDKYWGEEAGHCIMAVHNVLKQFI